MTSKDKDYIDRQNNQLRNDIDELKNRVVAVEGKSVSNTNGTVRIEFDRSELYTQLLCAVHDCLEQREAKLREEDRQRIEQLRAEAEARGKTFYASTHEWQMAMANSMDSFYNTMLGLVEIADKRYKHILTDLATLNSALSKAGMAPIDTYNTEQKEPLFSNLPSGILSASREIHRRVKSRLRTYLIGKFSIHRGYTILAILLYLTLLSLFVYTHVTISIT